MLTIYNFIYIKITEKTNSSKVTKWQKTDNWLPRHGGGAEAGKEGEITKGLGEI